MKVHAFGAARWFSQLVKRGKGTPGGRSYRPQVQDLGGAARQKA